jgi:hypothetical protein
MRTMASIPRSGRDPCAARPSTSTSTPTKPRCAIASFSQVGSATIAASARKRSSTASVPIEPASSSATAVTITSPRRLLRAASRPASMIAATLPFMSSEPRP